MKEITPEEQFEQTLHKLSEQLNELETADVDEKTLQLLEKLKNKTQSLIEKTKHEDTESTIKEAITHFEETHPDLTSTLQNLINLLNNIGI